MSFEINSNTMVDYRFDCRHFVGYMPCLPHKREGVECSSSCPDYDPIEQNILIIKLGAMGDIVRTTPILRRLKTEYPKARIFWLTHFKEVLPNEVDWPIKFSLEGLTWLRSLQFSIGINLDKDPEACALMDQLQIQKKYGFSLTQGMPSPINNSALHKFLTGISDTVSKANLKHYLEETFEIMGWNYKGEEYLLPDAKTNAKIDSIKFPGLGKQVVGLNTGCGGRWKTRQWPEHYWLELSRQLHQSGYNVLLLGGPDEERKNSRLAAATGAVYPGYFNITEFISLMKKCDIVVTTVTMAMHIAIGLKIPLVLFNNIFNPHEFYFFSNSTIVSPNKPCDCYFLPTCIHGESCMKDLSVESVFAAVQSLIP